MEKTIITKQIERVLKSCQIWNDYVTKLWELFGEDSEIITEEIINMSICNLFDTIVEARNFEEFDREFDIFEEILYDTALKKQWAECKTAEDIYNCFTNVEKIISLCKNQI